MIILAVESSCDETAVALVRDGRTVLADCIASSVEMHRIYGGAVPEIASRKHIEVIAQLADQALEQAGLSRGDIDAVAVTYAPGLIGAVLVGVSFAKSVAYALGVPLIPGTHRSQLPGPPRPGAPLCLPVRVWGHLSAGGCERVHGDGNFRRHPGRCSGGVL